VAGAWPRIDIGVGKLAEWVAMQLTIGQFYSPHVVNAAYGVGHTNGSLWTIPVELQFYVAIPVLYFAICSLRKPIADIVISFLILCFFALQEVYLGLSAV